MAQCHRNHAASKTTTHFRLWNSLSASSFRRIIFDAVSCGGSSRHRHNGDDLSTAASTESSTSAKQQRLEEDERPTEKLSDLLNIAERETEADAKKKEETLSELKQVVKELRGEDLTKRQIAAARVRFLAKEDSEARGSLAMLGAIQPLVGMLDLEEDTHSQIASLYALLNLGIGNDALVSLIFRCFDF